MEYVKINSVNGTTLNTTAGNIFAMGNVSWKAGDYCYTDGRVAYGNIMQGGGGGVITSDIKYLPIIRCNDKPFLDGDYYNDIKTLSFSYGYLQVNNGMFDNSKGFTKIYDFNIDSKLIFGVSNRQFCRLCTSKDKAFLVFCTGANMGSGTYDIYNLLANEGDNFTISSFDDKEYFWGGGANIDADGNFLFAINEVINKDIVICYAYKNFKLDRVIKIGNGISYGNGGALHMDAQGNVYSIGGGDVYKNKTKIGQIYYHVGDEIYHHAYKGKYSYKYDIDTRYNCYTMQYGLSNLHDIHTEIEWAKVDLYINGKKVYCYDKIKHWAELFFSHTNIVKLKNGYIAFIYPCVTLYINNDGQAFELPDCNYCMNGTTEPMSLQQIYLVAENLKKVVG